MSCKSHNFRPENFAESTPIQDTLNWISTEATVSSLQSKNEFQSTCPQRFNPLLKCNEKWNSPTRLGNYLTLQKTQNRPHITHNSFQNCQWCYDITRGSLGRKEEGKKKKKRQKGRKKKFAVNHNTETKKKSQSDTYGQAREGVWPDLTSIVSSRQTRYSQQAMSLKPPAASSRTSYWSVLSFPPFSNLLPQPSSRTSTSSIRRCLACGLFISGRHYQVCTQALWVRMSERVTRSIIVLKKTSCCCCYCCCCCCCRWCWYCCCCCYRCCYCVSWSSSSSSASASAFRCFCCRCKSRT